MVKESQADKSKTQNFAVRAAFWLTFIAISVGTITLFSWYFINGELAFSIERMATVMVINCLHALDIAISLVVAVSITLSAKNGIVLLLKMPVR